MYDGLVKDMNVQTLADFAITLLDDDNGIGEAAYTQLDTLLRSNGIDNIQPYVEYMEDSYGRLRFWLDEVYVKCLREAGASNVRPE